ncbi:hypothetical protein ACMFMG_007194 [Clarireedia jacksonii]
MRRYIDFLLNPILAIYQPLLFSSLLVASLHHSSSSSNRSPLSHNYLQSTPIPIHPYPSIPTTLLHYLVRVFYSDSLQPFICLMAVTYNAFRMIRKRRFTFRSI